MYHGRYSNAWIGPVSKLNANMEKSVYVIAQMP